MRIVGEMYRTGEGTEKNIFAAMHWLRQAAGHGNLAAQAELDELCAENTNWKSAVTSNHHQLAGSQNVYELHGSVHRNYCLACGEKYGLDYVLEHTCVPRCRKCGGIVRPDIVLYGENLDLDVMGKALEAIQSADTLLIGGTSLSVSPAADMIDRFQGNHLVIINQTATAADQAQN